MDKEIADAIREDAKRLDEINLQAGDVLDVKASMILVVITLLGALSTAILALEQLPHGIKVLQAITCLGMSVAVAFALIALWPCDFKIPPMPEVWLDYAEKLGEECKGHHNAPAKVLEGFHAARFRVALKRIGVNRQIARRKARFNDWAFYTTAVSICAELITLGWLALLRL